MSKKKDKNYLTEYRILINKLNQKRFYGLEGIKVGYTIAVPFQDMYTYQSVHYGFFKVIADIILDRYKLDIKTDAKILFFHRSGNDSNRREAFYNIKCLLDNSCYGRAFNQSKRHLLPIGYIIKHCAMSVYFYFKLRGLKLSLNSKLIFTSHLLCLFIYYDLIKSMNFNNCKFLVTYCDTETIENLLTQVFCKQDKKTITLQHGYFESSDINGKCLESIGFSYETMISDYFLCWGECTKNQALSSGIKTSIICTGVPQFIDYKMTYTINNNNIINVFLTGAGSKEYAHKTENGKLISIAKEYCKSTNNKFKVRLHPSLRERDYHNSVISEYFGGFSLPDEKLSEFAAQADICLVGNTSCFIELLFLNKVVFKIFHPFKSIYDNIDDFLVDSADDICTKLKNIEIIKEKSKKLKQYYIAEGDTKVNYISAFQEILAKK